LLAKDADGDGQRDFEARAIDNGEPVAVFELRNAAAEAPAKGAKLGLFQED